MKGEQLHQLPAPFGAYWVSSRGRVLSAKRRRVRELKPYEKNGTHLAVALSAFGRRTQRYVHDLVAELYIGPRPDADTFVRHLNGDAHDCRVVNLAYGTPSQNVRDCIRHGTHNRAQLSPGQVRRIRWLYHVAGADRPLVVEQLAEKFGVSKRVIRAAASGKTYAFVR